MKKISTFIWGISLAALGLAAEKPADADNFYKSDKVTMQKVSFPTQYKLKVAGNLFLPEPMKPGVQYPAIIVSHPMGAVKEQSANLYATKMAEFGFVALAIDLPFWGESEGNPRNAVSPDFYAEAFSAAVDFLGTRPFVDRNRIGAIGICGSGGFAISAAKIDPRLKAVATVSMYDMGAANRQALHHSLTLEQRKKILEQAAEQRYVEFEGGKTAYTSGTVHEITEKSTPIEREFYDFYRTPRGEVTPKGATPQTTTHPTLTSNVKFMNFYPFNDIETISPRALLFITGENAHSREFSEDAYKLAAEPKELYIVPGAGHVDLYDRVGLIPFKKLNDFFTENLNRKSNQKPRACDTASVPSKEGAETMTHLTVKEQKLAAIAAYAANGNLPELKKVLAAGLDAGLTVNEIKEILVQSYAYCGFPRSLNALGTFMALVKERGDKDPEGKLPGPLPAGKSIDLGTANQTKLCGAPVKGALFEFAPAIDEYLKAHLFGDIFARDNVDWRTRELATIAMLGAMTGVKPQLDAHIAIGKHNGLTDAEIKEVLAIAKGNAAVPPQISAFPVGQENTAYAKYFVGKSYLAPLTKDKRLNTPVFNVTFEPGCRNNWHKHTGGQMLIVVGGVGYYQERGQKARRLVPGDVVEIPPDVEHWHGAAPDSWFSHLAVECNPQTNKNTWLAAVSDADYQAATRPSAP